MSKLTQILVLKEDQTTVGNRPTVIASEKVYDVIPSLTNPYLCNVLVKRLDGTKNTNFTASSAPSAVRALLNAANSTDVKVIPVTQINNDATTQARAVAIGDIHKILIDPLNSAKSYVYLENQVLTQVNPIHASNTQASLLSAGNA